MARTLNWVTPPPATVKKNGLIVPTPQIEILKDGVRENVSGPVSLSGTGLQGTLTQQAAAGLVSFPGLSMSQLGNIALSVACDEATLLGPTRPTRWRIYVPSEPGNVQWPAFQPTEYSALNNISNTKKAYIRIVANPATDTYDIEAATPPAGSTLEGMLYADAVADVLLTGSPQLQLWRNNGTAVIDNYPITSVVAVDAPGLLHASANLVLRARSSAIIEEVSGGSTAWNTWLNYIAGGPTGHAATVPSIYANSSNDTQSRAWQTYYNDLNATSGGWYGNNDGTYDYGTWLALMKFPDSVVGGTCRMLGVGDQVHPYNTFQLGMIGSNPTRLIVFRDGLANANGPIIVLGRWALLGIHLKRRTSDNNAAIAISLNGGAPTSYGLFYGINGLREINWLPATWNPVANPQFAEMIYVPRNLSVADCLEQARRCGVAA